jgi:hypothetical protein
MSHGRVPFQASERYDKNLLLTMLAKDDDLKDLLRGLQGVGCEFLSTNGMNSDMGSPMHSELEVARPGLAYVFNALECVHRVPSSEEGSR